MLTRRGLIQTMAALAAAWCLPLAAAKADTPRPLNMKKIHRIVTLGDSITEGGGRPGGYVWLMDRALQALYPHHKIEIINAGISSQKSNDMLARFQKDVLDKSPDVVTISVGVNDVWHGFTPTRPAGYGPNRVPADAFYLNVREMILAAKKAGVEVVLFTPTPFEDHPNSARNLRSYFYNKAVRDLAKEHKLRLADQNRAFMKTWGENAPKGIKLTTDEVHLSNEGDMLMARTALLAFGIPEKKVDAALKSAQSQIPQRLP